MRHLRKPAICGALAIFLGLSGAAHAQDARLLKLLSEDFARSSHGHLTRCDRGTAIIDALRGLPADPSADDMQTFDAAAQALLNAVGSRALRIPRTFRQITSVSPDGRRVFAGEQRFDAAVEDGQPWSLFDPQTGALVADLVPFDEANDTGVMLSEPPVFSPDGSLIAVPVISDASIRLFAAEDGRELRRLTGLQKRGNIGATILPVGFNGDGSRYAAYGIGMILVWDVATGQIVVQHDVPLSNDPSIYPVGWDHLDRLLVSVQSGRSDDQSYTSQVIEIWDDTGARQPLLDLSSAVEQTVGPLFTHLSPRTAHMAIPVGRPVLQTWTLDGTRIGEVPMGFGYVVFTPDGKGVTAWNPDAADARVRRFSLIDGSEVPVQPHDSIPFLHYVCDMDGEGLGIGLNRFGNATYTGADLPTGRALYDFVWTNLPQQVRDLVESDRLPGQ
ncbi:WD40 repeat domain-containing protein [Maribius pontilimi]|uniref:WD40 repeat domain-containing protein n=1 Tax=Palleronia pontilimi TaxID=1964209 RepID=A0A934IHD9_9RHOB|nr:WD40 repeat domain-containing protein [Palleronia pontilimi]MBJ3762896.1 WD40 repeat domain-containing protein [Palleronia pontilimi]